jgi:hypothetical protein
MEPKRWGPFSGRQLTTIVLGIVAAVAFPVGAFAAGSAVTITDPVNNNQAKVDSLGKLQVGDNHLKTDILGNLRVAPQYGNVTAREAELTSAFSTPVVGVGASTVLIRTNSAAEGAIVTSIHATV